MPSVNKIYIYQYQGLPEYKIEILTDYIAKLYPRAKLELREEFFPRQIKQNPQANIDDLAKKLTLCRVHRVNQEVGGFTPMPLEIDYEKRRLKGTKKMTGVIYDGFLLQKLAKQFIDSQEDTLSACHIILTGQLIGSFDQNDKRYHLRVGIFGMPALISPAGLVEALAKPREYYLKQQMDINQAALEEEFRDQMITYEYKGISQLIKGYIAQALSYHLEGEAFCHDKNCRLYNAHWQKEAILAQSMIPYEFCSRHTEIIDSWQKQSHLRGGI